MWSRAARLVYLYEGGEWDELLREADDVLRWDREQGGTIIEVIVLANFALVLAHRGDLDQANRAATIFLPRAREIRDPQILNPALLSAALVAAMSGATADAVPLVTEFERGTRAQMLNRCEWLPMAVRVCAAAGELELAERLLEGVGQGPAGRLEHAHVTAKAIVAEARGQAEDAAEAYAEAAEGWAEWGSVIERGYALLGLARCAGDEQALRQGTEIFDRLRAVPFTALAA
jgi:hypothetical protein